MARSKQKSNDVSTEPVAVPSDEAAVVDSSQGDDELLPDLPWLRSIGEEDSQSGPAKRSGWAMSAVAGAIIVLAAIYGLSIRPTETIDAVPTPEPVVTSSQPVALPAPPSTDRVPSRKATTGDGKLIQLASFYSRNRAERYWREAQPRMKDLAKLRHSVVEGSVKGRTVYRLRASGKSAFDICDAMQKARIACLRIGH